MTGVMDWAVKELDDMLTAEPDHTRAAALFTAIRVLKTADEGEKDARPIRAGDRVRILKDHAEHASVSKGDILTVIKDWGDGEIDTEDGWVFCEPDSYERVNN